MEVLLYFGLPTKNEHDDFSCPQKFIAYPQPHEILKCLNKILDISLVISCFVVGFVMLAGAGSNLNQQFNIPFWAGSLFCAVLVILVSFLDFEKITSVIGIFTPMVFIMIVIIAIYTFVGHQFDMNELEQISKSIPSPMPNIWFSVLNYFALCVMIGDQL